LEIQVDTTIRGLDDQPIQGRRTLSGDGAVKADVTVAADAADVEVTLAFKQSDLTLGGLFFQSATAVTIETNSTSDPDDTFSVPAGGTFEVTALAADITSLFISNESDTTATVVYIRGVKDVTP